MEALQLSEMKTEAPQPGGPETSLPIAAQQGQPGAFDALVAKYRERVRRQCLWRGLSEDDAADVSQEVFVKAYRSLGRYQHHNAFGTWLHRITDNACTDFWRRRGRRLAVIQPMPVDPDGGEYESPSPTADPHAALEQAEVRVAIVEALESLAPILREAFVLKELHGLRYEEIARQVGCPQTTVRSRLFRARQELAERLAGLV